MLGTVQAAPVNVLVLRHVIGRMEAGSGFSPLQHAMIHDSAPVRVFSAPTGAGKSYAFQHAVLKEGARVLFIVPTRRLADNLARGLCEEFERVGRSDEIEHRLFVWTSDAVARTRAENPDIRVGQQRVRQLRALDGVPSEGVMIIATPESLAYGILMARMPDAGVSQMTIADILRFDHVVFDEFHTIQARGMGICAAIAKIASAMEGAVKLTFLSATPIEIRTPLVEFGVDPAKIVVQQETVVTGTLRETGSLRAIHGDVHLHLLEQATPCDALEAHLEEAQACLDLDRQVVLIYDRLKSLQADKSRLGSVLARLGLGRNDCLALDSIDDSVDEDRETFFTIGRNRDPLAYKALVATSSVEMGVTFRAGLIVMDAGHDPASFVQRIGRVARGDETGTVLICTPGSRTDRDAWLRSLKADLAAQEGICTINQFMEIALRAARAAFSTHEDADREDAAFRGMPARAVWCAALFWAAMEESARRQRGALRSLRDPGFRPPQVKRIHALLGIVAEGGDNGRTWSRAFLAEALRLRNITPRVRLRPPKGEGKPRLIPWHLYAGTPELRSAPARYDADSYGGEILEVLLDRRVEAVLGQLGTEPTPSRIGALFPHEAGPVSLSERTLLGDWLRCAERAAQVQLRRPERGRALEAAATLVRLTGIVPQVDTDDSVSGAGII